MVYLYRVIYLLLMADKGDAQLDQLVEAQPCDLVHADNSRRREVVAVPAHLQAAQPGVHRGKLRQIGCVRSQRVARLAGGDLPQGLGAADQLVQGLDDAGEARPVSALLLPAVQHQLVDRLGAVHWGWQAVTLNIQS